MAKGLGFVIVTHGSVGKGLLDVASHIMGNKYEDVRSVEVPFTKEMTKDAFPDHDRPYEAWHHRIAGQVMREVEGVHKEGGVILLTDILGGTAFNICREVLQRVAGVVIAGVNLPMVLKLPSVRSLSPEEAASKLVTRSRKAITWQVSSTSERQRRL
jgi:PTS system mannose-specific IIA component